MLLQYLRLSPKAEANIFAAGLTTIILLGSLALIVAIFGALWLAFQIVTLIFISISECCVLVGSLYSGADPLVKLLTLCAIGLVIYHVVRRVWRVK